MGFFFYLLPIYPRTHFNKRHVVLVFTSFKDKVKGSAAERSNLFHFKKPCNSEKTLDHVERVMKTEIETVKLPIRDCRFCEIQSVGQREAYRGKGNKESNS